MSKKRANAVKGESAPRLSLGSGRLVREVADDLLVDIRRLPAERFETAGELQTYPGTA
jgi:hypothetical protein